MNQECVFLTKTPQPQLVKCGYILANVVVPCFMQKDCPDLWKGLSFCPPEIGFQAILTGCERKSFRFRKKPLVSVIPLRNNPHNKEHPI